MSKVSPKRFTQRKRCFVTIGATAPFDRLLKAVLAPSFLRTLREYDYTELRLQYGKEGKQLFESFMQQHRNSPDGIAGLDITGFGLNQDGVVISHAGSGSILDAMRYSVPCVVVPNTDLLHNHQLELAQELARLQYVVHGKLEYVSATQSLLEIGS